MDEDEEAPARDEGREAGEPHDADAEQSDPESSASSDAPPEQQPGEGKSHDL